MMSISHQKRFANHQLAWWVLFVFALLLAPLTMNAAHFQKMAVSGRFLSPDPLGHGSSTSLYDYANGDPVNGLDPDGRFGKSVMNTPAYSSPEMPQNWRLNMSESDAQELAYGSPTAGQILTAAVSLVGNVAISPITSVAGDITTAGFGDVDKP